MAAERLRPRLGRSRPRHRPAPGFFSSPRVFAPVLGSRFAADRLGGYYLDFRAKPRAPDWSTFKARELHVATAQWGLGCYEHFLAGAGEAWLAAARAAGEHLIAEQVREGPSAGGWAHDWALRHTYRLGAPWLSAIAQGEGASLLLRIHRETGDERFLDAALLALRPLGAWTRDGGLRVPLGSDGFFLEEYPTDPPSLVLNGGIFALFGYLDAAIALDGGDYRRQFELGLDALDASIDRWDLGTWSRYDLYPHPVVNIASPFYHLLHIVQLRAIDRLSSRPRLAAALRRFERYQASRRLRLLAFARKGLFRLVVPRNRLLANRIPHLRKGGS